MVIDEIGLKEALARARQAASRKMIQFPHVLDDPHRSADGALNRGRMATSLRLRVGDSDTGNKIRGVMHGDVPIHVQKDTGYGAVRLSSVRGGR